ncbi:MAG: site-specific DNA-methyltransferase [Pirellulales bacterium]
MPVLDWIGKQAVCSHHLQVACRSLKRDDRHSVDNPQAQPGEGLDENMLVQADNLLALKALLPHFAGRVKCVYIDPPYNTGRGDWIYNDAVDSPPMRVWLRELAGSKADEMSRHDKWLCMMYPRLELLKELLHPEEGLIFVSVDDTEAAHLRLVMDEVFGAANWLATLTRRAMHTVRNSSRDFNANTDYVVAFARNKAWFGAERARYLRVPADKTSAYPHDDQDGKGAYKLDPLHARNYYRPYQHVFGNGMCWSAPPGTYPRYAVETLRRMEADGGISFNGRRPRAKRYLSQVQAGRPPDTLLSPKDVGFNKDGTVLLREMLGGGAFPQPKPLKLIQYLLSMVRDPEAIVLDSFAGSGTTGHAVLAMNHADGGQRRFILVEVEPDIARQVTARRLELAIRGYTPTTNGSAAVAGLGGSFGYYTLAE